MVRSQSDFNDSLVIGWKVLSLLVVNYRTRTSPSRPWLSLFTGSLSRPVYFWISSSWLHVEGETLSVDTRSTYHECLSDSPRTNLSSDSLTCDTSPRLKTQVPWCLTNRGLIVVLEGKLGIKPWLTLSRSRLQHYKYGRGRICRKQTFPCGKGWTVVFTVNGKD